jgi:hypothetical protein
MRRSVYGTDDLQAAHGTSEVLYLFMEPQIKRFLTSPSSALRK